MFHKFALYAYMLFAYDEGLGVQDTEPALEGGKLVLGDYSEYDVGGFLGVAAFGFPVGGSPDQLFQDIGHDLIRIFFGENEYLGADVLTVGAIHDQGAYCGVDDAVDDQGDVKQQGAGQVDKQVYRERKTAYAEILAALGEVDAQDVHTAAGAAVFEGDADSGSCYDSSDETGCQGIFYQGNSRYGNDGEEHGLADNTDQGAYKEPPADGTVARKNSGMLNKRLIRPATSTLPKLKCA